VTVKRFFKLFFIFSIFIGLIVGSIGTAVGFYFYFRITRDLPRIEKVSDYVPKASSLIFAQDGTLMAERFEERRYPVLFEDIPLRVRQAFLAAEDASFYTHPGIDFISILRASYKNFQHRGAKQGASTITQQVVKALLLSKEKTLERKAKEAILAYRLEKALTKDEILSIYLNEIFLGAHAYGIKSAAREHLHKELNDLTIADAAFLAALPQRPSELINPKNKSEAVARQHYVLEQMLKNKMITEAEFRTAIAEKLNIYPTDLNTIYHAPYYVSHVDVVANEILRKIDPSYTLTSPGGFKIHTVADLQADEIASRAVKKGLRELDKRRGWRGPLKNNLSNQEFVDVLKEIKANEVYVAKIIKINKGGLVEVRVGEFEGTVDLKSATWARRMLTKNDQAINADPLQLLSAGQYLEVSLDATKIKDKVVSDITRKLAFGLDQTPEVQGAFLCTNALTGEVKAIVGGYDYYRSVFNRATQGMLQPGSSFKPFIYTAAVDHGFTPSSMVPDSPISFVAGNGKIWAPKNFDGKYLGPITLRTALQRSRNVVSVWLLSKLGVEKVIESARNFGITTPIVKNMSIALGTPEVKMIEMVSAYGVFAAGGYLANQLVVSKIEDRFGNIIYEQHPKQKRVLSEDTAFVMANMMKGVVERGTATIIKKLEKPAAGKTGTTNSHLDAWFIGYTPEWSAGAWVGFDVKRPLGKQETGGKAAAPIFLYFMQEFLKDTPPLDFDPPDGVVPVAVDLNSGRPVSANAPGAFIEYFKTGTEPGGESNSNQDFGTEPGSVANDSIPNDYLMNSEF
jgi:penicillin-binding protein 1A